jgi:predicted homoserine dehydrogenase-like protein
MSVFVELERHERAAGPLRIAVVGTGFFGAGLVRRIARIRGMVPAVAANRTLERAVAALLAAGVERRRIKVADDPPAAQAALEQGWSVATARLDLPAEIAAVDVIMEATGDVLVGATVALGAIRRGKHIVAANPETQATVGPILAALAGEAGVVYSDVDGDEPGILATLHRYCAGIGLAPLVAGNCKGVLKRYATPATQAAFAAAHNLKPWIASAAADGTKLACELATVANATGMPPAVRGMVGPQTTLETLAADFERLGLLDHGPIVEYTLGIAKGVFVVVREDDPLTQGEFRYLKMGDGPYYVFHRPDVLVHYAAPVSAAQAALYRTATVTPLGPPVAEVAAYAKQDLQRGQRLDGIGGHHSYGLIVRAEEARRERLLPIGLAGYARLTRPLRKDEPITTDDVEFETGNVALDLWRQQNARFGAPVRSVNSGGSAFSGRR